MMTFESAATQGAAAIVEKLAVSEYPVARANLG